HREVAVLLQHDPRVVSVAKPCGALRDDLQHRTYVRWRRGDHTENGARRRLLLQRLRKLGIARLSLVEQASVLDGDDCLVCEDLQKSDLLLRERLRLEAAQGDRSDRCALAQKRTGYGRAVTQASGHRAPRGEFLAGGAEVGYLDRLRIHDRA